VFPFVHMFNFFANELTSLRRRGLALLRITMGAFDNIAFRHDNFLSKKGETWSGRIQTPLGGGVRGLIEAGSDRFQSVLAGPKNPSDAILAIVKHILSLIYPAASLPTNLPQAALCVVHQPLARLFAGKRRKEKRYGHADSEPG